MSEIMRVLRLPHGNMSYIIHIIQIIQMIQMRNLSALKKLDHELYWESMICLICANIVVAVISVWVVSHDCTGAAKQSR